MCRVSVIMPLYNASKYLNLTIDSILRQTYTNFELIVVDDCSTDDSYDKVAAINDKRIKLYRNEENYGIAYTRNRAIDLANGEYIAIMDDDDIAPVYRLKEEVEYLDKETDVIAVCGHCRYIDSKGNDMGKQWNVFSNPYFLNAYMLFSDAVPNSTGMIRKEVIEKNHIKFVDKMFGTEDYRFWAECSLHGYIGSIDKVMMYWRVNHGSETDRVLALKNEQRKAAIDSIHEYLLTGLGFELQNEHLNIINKVFSEEGVIDSREEIENLYSALQEVASQALKLKLSNANEIVAMCRKRFGEKIGKAFFLWSE